MQYADTDTAHVQAMLNTKKYLFKHTWISRNSLSTGVHTTQRQTQRALFVFLLFAVFVRKDVR